MKLPIFSLSTLLENKEKLKAVNLLFCVPGFHPLYLLNISFTQRKCRVWWQPLQGYKQSPSSAYWKAASDWSFSVKPTRPVVYPRNKIFCYSCCWNHKHINWHRHLGCVIKGTFTFILNSSEYIFLADSQPHIYVSFTYRHFIRGKEFTLKDYTSVTLQSHESHIFVYSVTMHSVYRFCSSHRSLAAPSGQPVNF